MINISEKTQLLINLMDHISPCAKCGMRWSTGDYECPHCGEDQYEKLYQWAELVIEQLFK